MEEPQRKEFEAQTVISMDHRGPHDDIGLVYHKLYEWAKSHDVEVTGRGLTIFHCPPNEFNSKSGLFEVCLPVESAPEGDTEVKVRELPACTVACVAVAGPYDQIPARYTEMLAWLDVEGWEVAGPPREVYLKRPAFPQQADPNEFLTEIQFPIKQ